jgi:hypothetical protein
VNNIEAEIEKLLPCARYETMGTVCVKGVRHCVTCSQRPAIVEFCRKLVADKDKIITAILGRCADLLDSDQFNNIEALAVDVEPTFNEAVKTLQARVAELEQENNDAKFAVVKLARQLAAERAEVMKMKFYRSHRYNQNCPSSVNKLEGISKGRL